MTNNLYRDRESYWAMLGRIAVEVSGPINVDAVHIQKWCETQYGFRLIYDQDGGITAEHEVLDPQKYMLCLLKHGG